MATNKRLFYDIETSFCEGHFWRPGYNQTISPNQILKYGKIICISWKWQNNEKIYNLNWGLHKQSDKKMLTQFIKELDIADEIVAHNGDKFDIKWIRARAAKHNLIMKPAYRMIDTYKLCKKYFALPSYKLGEVAKYFSLTAKQDPGGLQTWIDIVIHRKQEALERMIQYCDGDVITLEQVYQKIRKYTEHKYQHAVKAGFDKFFCPECMTLPHWNKSYTTAAGTVQHYMRCKDKECGQFFKINNKTYMDYLQYKMINAIK